MKSTRLAIIVSHPIQYYSPLFRELAKEFTLKVFYCFNPSSEQQGKDGFGISFKWDIDLFDGYDYEFLDNISDKPSSAHKNGCDTPMVGYSLDAYSPTHVVTFGWHLKSYHQVLKYCKSKSVPIAVRGDSQIDPLQYWIKRLIKQLYYPFFLNQFDAFLSVGERNRAYLKSYKVSDSKIIFSPHAVDRKFWKVEPESHEKFSFVWVAKFIDKKRPLDCIAAFNNVVKTHTDCILKMVGTGALLEKAKLAAEGNANISFLGFKNQTALRGIYSESDCLVLTSDYRETWGLVVNEAFEAGLPAIVSSACGCAPDLIDGSTGMIYELGDIEQLTNSMLRLVTNQKLNYTRDNVLDKVNRFSYLSIVKSFREFTINF